MLYLSALWQIVSNNYGMLAVSVGNTLVLYCFLRPRFHWSFCLSLTVLNYLSLPLLLKLGYTLLGAQTAGNVLLVFLGYIAVVLGLIGFKEQLWKTTTLLFAMCILNRLFTFWGYFLHIPLNSLFGSRWDIQASITSVIGFLYAIISLVCWLVLKDRGRKLIQTGLRRHNWVVLGSIAIAAKIIIDFCSDFVFNLDPYSEKRIILAMIALCTFAFAVLVLYLYSTLATMKHIELKTSAERLNFEKEAQKRYYETQLQNQEELRRMKHDMNGHLNTISQLLSENKKEEALNLLAKLGDYTENHQKSLYCDDPYLNAVVTNYAALFAQSDTPFELDIHLGKSEAHCVEMCLVLNNALQNALEASQKLLPEQRYVRLQVKTKQSRLLLRVTNRFNHELILEGGLPHTTKHHEGHGYGLKSIRKAAESVGGFADFKIEGDLFVLDVAV